MSAADLRQKTEDELKDAILALRKEAFNMRFQRANGQLENTAHVRKVRRSIAQLKTILNEKKAGLNVAVAKKAPAKKETVKKAPAKKKAAAKK